MEVKNNRKISTLVEQLNIDLEKKLALKKTLKEKRKLKEYPWIYLAIGLILLLLIITWFVISRMPIIVH